MTNIEPKLISLRKTYFMKVVKKSTYLLRILNLSYQKKNMVYDDYNWSTKYFKNDPRIKGQPDETVLGRKEGKEMLYFINKCARKWGWSHDIFAMQRLEKIIREAVPGTIHSQIDIYKWIQENYESI